ncbi:MAG TPA: hypothetical protein VNL98_02780 [Gemmatimonadales bacterium]|nr:hypothetical protein [Gemmatimonadales bacterium]
MTRKPLSDEELDLLVVRALSRLPAVSPSRGFSDRVMARVQLPPPRPLALIARARAWLSEPRRAIAFAVGYAIAASIALIITVPWLLTSVPEVRTAAQWLGSQLAAAGRDLVISTAGWAVKAGLTGALRGLSLSDPAFWVACFGVSAAYTACVVGLQRVLHAPARRSDASARVSA